MRPAAILQIAVEANTAAATASLSKFDRGLKTTGKTATAAGRYTDTLNKRTGMLGGSLRRAGGYAASAAAAYLSISQAKAAVTTTQELAKTTAGLNRNLGLSIERGSQWAAVAKSRDIDTKALNMSFTTLSRRLTDASKGSESAIDTFKDLGLTEKDLKKTGGDFNQQLLLVADAFGEAGGGAIRQQAAQKLLGRGYQTLLPLFAEGSKGLKEQFGWAAKYGAELDQNTVEQQMKLTMMLRESKVAALGLQIAFTEAITPALKTANREFQRITEILNSDKLTNAEKFEKVGKILEGWADKALDAFLKILPIMAERAANAAPKIAAALGKGLLNAEIWGRLFAAGWLLSRLGGVAMFSKAGKTGGTAFGRGFRSAAVLALLLAPDAFNFGKKLGEKFKEQGYNFGYGFGKSFADAFNNTIGRFPGVENIEIGPNKYDQQKLAAELEARRRDEVKRQKNNLNYQLQQQREFSQAMLGDVKSTTNKTTGVQEKGARQGTKAAGDLRRGVSGNFEGLAKTIKQGLENIQSNTNKSLGAFGAKELRYKLQEAQLSDTSSGGFQRGGLIPGAGDGDRVHVMAEPGEGFINKKAVAALGGRGAIDRINSAVPRFAAGGIVPAPGFPGEQINSKVLGAFQSLVKRFNLFLTDAYGPGHASSEHTKYGTAIDVIPGAGGSWAQVGQAVAYAVKAGFNPVYYDGSSGSINLPPHGPGHHAHITLLTAAELLSGKSAGGGFASKIARVLLEGPAGPLKNMGQGALDKARSAANKFLSKKMSMAGAHGAINAPGGLYDKRALMSLWSSTGGNGNAALMAAIALAESGGNPSVTNSIGARGLWQIMPYTAADFGFSYGAMTNPAMNAKAAHAILAGQGLGAWEAYTNGAYQQFMQKGGMVEPYVGSFASGGTVSKDGVAKVHKGEHISPAERKEWDKLIHQQLKEMNAELSEANRLRRQARGVVRDQGKRWILDAMGEEIADVGVRSSRYAGNGKLTNIGGRR